MKVLSIIGTRPEAIKMASVIRALSHSQGIESRVLSTGQHREMLKQVLGVFNITPDYELDVMQYDQTPLAVLATILQRIEVVLREFQPDWVLVQGDTTTVLGATIAAVYTRCRVGHVEAGLRTYDRDNPFPEEINRVLVDHASQLYFAPTQTAREALLKENLPDNCILVTGNTVIDALRYIGSQQHLLPPISFPKNKRLLLVTAHRRENHGEPLKNIFNALRQIATREDVHIVYPVHRNPNVALLAHEMLSDVENIQLLEPLDYLSFVAWMKQACLILTDSGGIQEEAPALGVPVLVLRTVTERPEAVVAGVAKLVGTDTDLIVSETNQLLDDPVLYDAMANAVNPFGDGTAAEQIVEALWLEK